MSASTPNWRTMFAVTKSEGESGQLEPMIEDTQLAIQQQLRESVVNSSAVSEENELYAALRVLRRMRAQLLRAA